MYKLHNFQCNTCGKLFEDLVQGVAKAECPCGSSDTRLMPAAMKTFSVIQATTPTAKRYKAGYVHRYHRPAEKISVQVPKTAKVGGK